VLVEVNELLHLADWQGNMPPTRELSVEEKDICSDLWLRLENILFISEVCA